MSKVTIEVPDDASPMIKRAVEWLAGLAEMLIRKNAAYGSSAENPMRVFSRAAPIEQVLVRIDDKLSRLARGAGLLATDEDTVRDLAGYLAIYAALRQEQGAAAMRAQPGAMGCDEPALCVACDHGRGVHPQGASCMLCECGGFVDRRSKTSAMRGEAPAPAPGTESVPRFACGCRQDVPLDYSGPCPNQSVIHGGRG